MRDKELELHFRLGAATCIIERLCYQMQLAMKKHPDLKGMEHVVNTAKDWLHREREKYNNIVVDNKRESNE